VSDPKPSLTHRLLVPAELPDPIHV